MPRRTISAGASPPIGSPVEGDLLARRAHQATQRLHEGALAGAVGADDRHHLAGLEPEVDAEQRLRVAVARAEPVRGEQRHASIPM